jgi:hypothetical protein
MTVVTGPSTSILTVPVPVVSSLDSDVGFVVVDPEFHFLGASNQLIRIAVRVLTSGETISWPSPCGSNCSYTVSFDGPTWKCDEIQPPTDIPDLGYTGNLNGPYYAVDTFMSGLLNVNNSQNDGLWIIYGLPPNNVTIHCGLYNSTYTTDVQYTNNVPTFNTSVVRYQQITDGDMDDSAMILSNPGPENIDAWRLLNFYAIHNAVGRPLIGSVQIRSGYGLAYKNSIIGWSSLVQINDDNFNFTDNFSNALEDYFVNTTLSLTHFLQSPPVSQIEGSDMGPPAINMSMLATVVTYPARYKYSSIILWRVYGIAIGCTAVCVLIGCYALFRNRVDASMSFSQILVTTRNATIDRLCDGESLGGHHISNEFLDTRLRYGKHLGYQTHACFGLDDEIRPCLSNREPNSLPCPKGQIVASDDKLEDPVRYKDEL